jgi:hypothetical protein
LSVNVGIWRSAPLRRVANSAQLLRIISIGFTCFRRGPGCFTQISPYRIGTCVGDSRPNRDGRSRRHVDCEVGNPPSTQSNPLAPNRCMPPRHILRTALFLSCGLFSSLIVQGGEQVDQSRGASTQKCDCAVKCSRSGRWFVAETDNFQACALDTQATAKLLAETAELLRHD